MNNSSFNMENSNHQPLYHSNQPPVQTAYNCQPRMNAVNFQPSGNSFNCQQTNIKEQFSAVPPKRLVPQSVKICPGWKSVSYTTNAYTQIRSGRNHPLPTSCVFSGESDVLVDQLDAEEDYQPDFNDNYDEYVFEEEEEDEDDDYGTIKKNRRRKQKGSSSVTELKGEKSTTFISVHEDVNEKDVDKLTKSHEEEGPRLVLFLKGQNQLEMSVIAADNCIYCQGESAIDSIMILMACYYVFNIDYPRKYNQCLGFLQQYVLGDAFTGEKSAKYKHFVKKITDDF